MHQQITVRNIEKPYEKEIEEDVYWLCDSFGFSTGRDLEHVTSRTVLELLRLLARSERTSSDRVAEELGISQARLNYHVRNLMDAGFLFRERRTIHLRSGSVKSAIEEMRKDANRIFDDLALVAEEIDSRLGFKNR